MEESKSIKKEIFSGVLYTSIAKYSSLIVTIGITAILARILSPSDFGVVAIATVFSTFFSTLTTVGVSPAIIQNKELNEIDYGSINAFCWIIALVLTFLFFLISNVISDFYAYGVLLEYILKILSFSIFFNIISIVPNALLLKEKQFKFIAIRSFFINVFGAVVSLLFVYYGYGIYSLVVNPIVGSVLLCVINYINKPVGFAFKLDSIKKIASFSFYQFLANSVCLIYRNLDKLVVGRYFGSMCLGYYEKSYKLMMLPMDHTISIVGPVLHPVLSGFQGDKVYLSSVYKKITFSLAELGFILGAILFNFSDILIILLFGTQWMESIPIFKVLSFSIPFQILMIHVSSFFQTLNKVDYLFISGLFLLAFIVFCVFLGVLFEDILFFSIFLDVAYFLGFISYNMFMSKLLKFSMLDILLLLLKPFFCFLILVSVSFFFEYYFVNLFVKVIFSSLLYILFFYFFYKIRLIEYLPSQILKSLK